MPRFHQGCRCLKVLAVVEVHFSRGTSATDVELEEAIGRRFESSREVTLGNGRRILMNGAAEPIGSVHRIIREVPYAPAV